MNKRDLNLLEAVYGNEINQAIAGRNFPFQSKSKHYKRLEEEGYVRNTTTIIPRDKGCPFPITVSGWELTLLGNFTYCMSCDEPEEL